MTASQDKSTRRPNRAAKVVDDNFEKLAMILDRVRADMTVSADGSQPVPMWAALDGQLGSASHRLRATSGDEVVDYAKGHIARHPTLITLAAAATAAALAQVAIAAIRRDQREPISNDLERAAS